MYTDQNSLEERWDKNVINRNICAHNPFENPLNAETPAMNIHSKFISEQIFGWDPKGHMQISACMLGSSEEPHLSLGSSSHNQRVRGHCGTRRLYYKM